MTLDLDFADRLAATLAMGAKPGLLDAQKLAPSLPPQTPPLALLALAGALRRFTRAPLPTEFDARETIADERPRAPDALRPLLAQLPMEESGVAAQAIADALARRKLALHPYDLARYPKFVRAFADQLGARAVAFALRNAPKDAESDPLTYFADVIDETNWSRTGPGRQAQFLRTLRASDPARARELLAVSFAALAAPARLKTLETLETGLSPDDLPFIESLAGDRAPKVRGMAESLMSRIPGAAAFEERLKTAVASLKVEKVGLINRKTVVSVSSAFQKGSPQEYNWAVGVFGGLPIGPLASALGLDDARLIAAVAADGPLFVLLARQALLERRFDLLDNFGEAPAELWRLLLMQPGLEFDLPAADRARFVDALIAPARWRELPHPQEMARLYEFLRAPFPAAQAQALIASKAYRDFIASALHDDGAHHIAIVAFTPASLRPQLRQALAPLPLASTSLALALLSALDLIDPA